VITALAHAARVQPFNGLFYATTATVIPVLFLAITLQGDTYKNLLRALERSNRSYLAAAAPDNLRLRSLLTIAAQLLIATTAQTGALLILSLGIGGEIGALWSLYDGSNTMPPILVLIATAALTAIIGIELLWAYIRADRPNIPFLFLRTYLRLLGPAMRGELNIAGVLAALVSPTATPPGGETAPAADHDNPQPEPGKTDAS